VRWLLLLGAIGSEVIATSALKMSDGLSRLTPTVIVGVGYLAAFILLGKAIKQLEVSTAYAIWSGLGTAAICLIGAFAFGESLTAAKTVGVLLVIGGVVVLNLAGAS
jgi:small multidrug resistance pump